MGKLKTFSIFFLFLLIFTLLTFNIYAADYPSSGYNDNVAGRIAWDSTSKYKIPELLGSSNELNNPEGQILVGDLDGDGDNDILAYESEFGQNRLVVYDENTLIELSRYHIGPGFGSLSGLYLYDWDFDGAEDMFVFDNYNAADGELRIISWNGSLASWNETLIGVSSNAVQHIIACDPDDVSRPLRCIIVYFNYGATGSAIGMRGFNGSLYGPITTIYDDSIAPFDYRCLPANPRITVADINQDGVNEFIFNYFIFGQAGNSEGSGLEVWTVDDNSSLTLLGSSDRTSNDWITAANVGCDNSAVYAHDKISNVYVGDIDGNTQNGLEAVYGVMVDDGLIKMYSYHWDASNYDSYPHLSNGIEADWVGNTIFKTDAFHDTGIVDFCVNYQSITNGVTGFFCASEETETFLGFGDSDIWTGSLHSPISTSIRADITTTAFSSHAENNDIRWWDGQGSWIRQSDDLCTGDSCTIVRDFTILQPNASLTLVDAENIGYADIYFLTRTNIYMYQDGWTNSGCGEDGNNCITGRYKKFNPNNERTWQNETQVEISVQVIDENFDNVSSRVYLYYGGPNEQVSGWKTYASTGTTFSHSFVANTTVVDGVIRIEARDEPNNTTIEVNSYNFNVALEGIVFNEETRTEEDEGDDDPDDPPGPGQDADGDDVVENSVQWVQNLTGFTALIIWLLLMGIVAVVIWRIGVDYVKQFTGMSIFGIIVFVEFILVILGNIWGFIGFGTLIAIVIVALAILAVTFRSTILGNGGG